MPRLLDTYGGAGGAAVGYHRAGFEVVGVDLHPQPNYPYEFHQGDAIEYILAHGHEFDFIHASPPCPYHASVQQLSKARNGGYPDHPELIGPTREALKKVGVSYCIENVMGARKHMLDPIVLCGKTFGLHVYRHRCFESSLKLFAPMHIPHRDKTPSAGNGKSPKGFISVCGTGGVKGMNSKEIIDYFKYAMGIDWTVTRKEIGQAIPPAYTEHIGRQVMEQLCVTA